MIICACTRYMFRHLRKRNHKPSPSQFTKTWPYPRALMFEFATSPATIAGSPTHVEFTPVRSMMPPRYSINSNGNCRPLTPFAGEGDDVSWGLNWLN